MREFSIRQSKKWRSMPQNKNQTFGTAAESQTWKFCPISFLSRCVSNFHSIFASTISKICSMVFTRVHIVAEFPSLDCNQVSCLPSAKPKIYEQFLTMIKRQLVFVNWKLNLRWKMWLHPKWMGKKFFPLRPNFTDFKTISLRWIEFEKKSWCQFHKLKYLINEKNSLSNRNRPNSCLAYFPTEASPWFYCVYNLP